jgi:hypothetical protein
MRDKIEVTTITTRGSIERPAIYGPNDEHFMIFKNRLVEVKPVGLTIIRETVNKMLGRRKVL